MFRIFLPLLLCAGHAPAAWLTFKNDTPQTLILQEIVVVRGKAVPGKPVKLPPGQTFREFQAVAATRTIQVLEPGPRANTLLLQDNVTVKDADVTLSIAVVKKQVTLLPVASAKK